jgi:hypothetical protein
MVAGNFAMEFTEGCGGEQATMPKSSEIDSRIEGGACRVRPVAGVT